MPQNNQGQAQLDPANDLQPQNGLDLPNNSVQDNQNRSSSVGGYSSPYVSSGSEGSSPTQPQPTNNNQSNQMQGQSDSNINHNNAQEPSPSQDGSGLEDLLKNNTSNDASQQANQQSSQDNLDQTQTTDQNNQEPTKNEEKPGIFNYENDTEAQQVPSVNEISKNNKNESGSENKTDGQSPLDTERKVGSLNPDKDLTVKPADQSSQGMQNAASVPNAVVPTQPNPSVSNTDELDIKPLLDLVIQKGASDMHLSVGYPIHLRIDGDLEKVGNQLSNEQVKALIFKTLNSNQRELLEVNKEVDLSYAHEDKGRFRVNAYFEKGNFAAAYRLIPNRIRTLEELKMPQVISDFTELRQGLFLVTGPTGSGKSTTLAAMINQINNNSPTHIITIEDPIEYVYPKGKALVDQREIGQDTHDWGIALKSILRQDPDIVLVGEMRDYETIQAAITTAETGHLVFGTLHTSSAAQSIDRIIDVFPPHQQSQIRSQLSVTLKGILSQRLIPVQGGGRVAVYEIMIVTSAISNLIREGKTYQIDNIISTSSDIGMVTMEKSLAKIVREGKISVELAQEYSIRPEELLKILKSS